jgi:Peptidase family M1 domain
MIARKPPQDRFLLAPHLCLLLLMQAMENKGLNVFNTAYVLADEKTATDGDFERVEGVIGHEVRHSLLSVP